MNDLCLSDGVNIKTLQVLNRHSGIRHSVMILDGILARIHWLYKTGFLLITLRNDASFNSLSLT